MRAPHRGSQAGFTLLELIIVIALTAILAGVLASRYQDLSARAHEGAVYQAGSAFASGVNLYRAHALAAQLPEGRLAEGFPLAVNERMYPIGEDPRFDSTDDCSRVWFAAFEDGQRPELVSEAGLVNNSFTVRYLSDLDGGGPRCVFAYATAGHDNALDTEASALKIVYWPDGARYSVAGLESARDSVRGRGPRPQQSAVFWFDSSY